MTYSRIARLTFLLFWLGGPSARAESLAETVVRLSNELAALRARVDLANGKGKQIAYLGLSNTDNGFLTLNGTDGSSLLKAFASNGIGGSLQILNAEGKMVIDINTGVQNHAGYARFFDRNGRETAYIGTLINGSGGLFIEGDQIKDFAEAFDVAGTPPAPGSVMSAVGDGRHIRQSSEAYDTRVLGVISGAGGMSAGLVFGSAIEVPGRVALALAGQVYVRVCNENGAIQPGDLLVSSSTPGIAMRASNAEKAFGAVVGKALTSYNGTEREGLLRMLVMMH